MALRWSMRRGRIKESLFWALELLDSELEDRLRDELYSIWVWYFGIGCLAALPLLSNDTLLDVVNGLTRVAPQRCDRSGLALLLYACQDTKEPDRPSFFHHLQEQKYSDLEQAFVYALYQGKSRLAFDLSCPLWSTPSKVYELLQVVQTKKHNNPSLAEILTLLEFNESLETPVTRAVAIAAVCLDRKRLKSSLQPLTLTLPKEVQESLSEWRLVEGRRHRRVFPIPPECLYMKTARGNISNKETTISNIYAINDLTVGGCPFWERVLEEEAPWLGDERKECFWELYFPDDIPDEWSKEDQEKSHGRGSLINNEVPSILKYIDRWFRSLPTRAYWFSNRDLTRLSASYEKVFERPWSEIVSTWCLTPVKRRVLVVDGEV